MILSLRLTLFALLLQILASSVAALELQDGRLINATPYSSSLVDDSDLLDIHELSSPAYQGQFHAVRKNRLHASYLRHGLWLRLTISNSQSRDRDAELIIDQPSISLLHAYVAASAAGTILQVPEGITQPATHPLWQKQAYIFRVPLPAHSARTVYLRLSSKLSLNPRLLLTDDYGAGAWQAQQNLILGLAWGALLSLLLVNFFAFFRTRQVAHLDYMGFLLALFAYSASHSGYFGLAYPAATIPENDIELASLLVLLVLALKFLRNYLQFKRHLPIVHHILGLELGMLLLLLVAMPILPLHALARMSAEATLFVALSLILSAALAALRRLPQARIYLFASLPVALITLGNSSLALAGVSFSDTMAYASLYAVLVQGWVLILHIAMRAGYLRQEVAQLAHQLQRSESSLKMRTRFIKHISHEMRTPMSGILGMTELLRDTPLTPRQREYANIIEHSTQSLLRILNDLLDFATRDGDSLSLVEEPVELSGLLDDCLSTFRNLAEEKSLELIGAVDPALPTHIIADPTRLRQIISSLLRNALRHTQRGDIELRLLPGQERHLRCEVHDTGIGLPKDQLLSLFEAPLLDIDEQILDTHLGLTVCRQLVHLMGGRMGAESTERVGTCIWFELPLKIVAHPLENGQDDGTALEGLRLLVVDDNPTMLRVIEQQASSWGMKVSCCDHGQQALALARNAAMLGEPFAVIVLDQNMPGMNGLQLAAHIKEDPLITRDVLMLMLTGMRTAPTYTMASNAGIRRVLTKPLTVRQLKRAICEELSHIERKPPEQELQGVDAATQLKQMRILVAEDNPLSQKVIRGMVLKLGAECTVVNNGKEAVEEISRRSYDVILMDCDMPHMDGYIATQSIREWEHMTQRRPTPILALTGHILDEHQARSLEAGMNEHLSKPVELSELRAALLRWSTY